MVRSVVSIIIASLLIIAGGIAEDLYLDKTFSDLSETFTQLKNDVEDGDCTEAAATYAQEKWISEKEKLHIFIPHADIREVDLWVAESVAYIKAKNYEEAADKIYVALRLFQKIPESYSLRLGNLL